MSFTRRTMEGTVLPIIDYVRTNIDAALAETRTDRPDDKVNLETIKEYFIYSHAVGYKVPCLFVLGRNVEFLQSRGQNHINAKVAVQVSIVVEDRTSDKLTYKCWRYVDALHGILDQAEIVTTNNKIKNKIKVTSTEFGDAVQMKSSEQSPFRMEAMLVLDVEHYEQN